MGHLLRAIVVGIIMVVIFFTDSARSAAQTINFGAVQSGQQNILQVTSGLESGLVTGVGYGRVIRCASRTSVLSGDLTMVIVNARDYRLRLGGTTTLLISGPWMLTGKLYPLLRGASSSLGRMTSLGVEGGLGGGYFGQHWYTTAELGMDWAASTHISHSDRYRTTIYANARDGWYSSTGTRLVYGLSGGYSWHTVDAVVRVGQARDLEFNTWFIPFYATFGVNLRWH